MNELIERIEKLRKQRLDLLCEIVEAEQAVNNADAACLRAAEELLLLAKEAADLLPRLGSTFPETFQQKERLAHKFRLVIDRAKGA